MASASAAFWNGRRNSTLPMTGLSLSVPSWMGADMYSQRSGPLWPTAA
jgi:hypothetical protein